MTISKTRARLIVLETLAGQAMSLNWVAVLDQDAHAREHAGQDVERVTLDDQVLVYGVAAEIAAKVAHWAGVKRADLEAEATAEKELAEAAEAERAKLPLIDTEALQRKLDGE